MRSFMVFIKKKDFIVYMPMHASDVIINVIKQNMNVIASTFSTKHVKRWRDKNKKVSAN